MDVSDEGEEKSEEAIIKNRSLWNVIKVKKKKNGLQISKGVTLNILKL